MAEYIDREQLLELINEDCKYQNPTNEYTRGCNEVCDWAIKTIKNIPTADVVPKSEVERLTVELDAMRGAANTYKMHYENAMKEIERLKDYNTGVAFKHYFDGRKEVAREIFEEIDTTIIAEIDLSNAVLVELECAEELYNRTKGEVLALCKIQDFIAELKKKYIGGNDNG